MHVDKELLVPKDEPQDVEQPQAEDHGLAENTHAEPSTRDGRKHTKKDDRLLLDARENVGAPTSQQRQKISPKRYTGYMDLMSESIEIGPSSFEEAV